MGREVRHFQATLVHDVHLDQLNEIAYCAVRYQAAHQCIRLIRIKTQSGLNGTSLFLVSLGANHYNMPKGENGKLCLHENP